MGGPAPGPHYYGRALAGTFITMGRARTRTAPGPHYYGRARTGTLITMGGPAAGPHSYGRARHTVWTLQSNFQKVLGRRPAPQCKASVLNLHKSDNIVSQACAQKVFHYAFCMYTLSARFANVLMMQGIYHRPGTRAIWTGHTSNFLVHGEHARTCWTQTLGWNLWFFDMGTCPVSGVRNGTLFS